MKEEATRAFPFSLPFIRDAVVVLFAHTTKVLLSTTPSTSTATTSTTTYSDDDYDPW